MKRLFILLSVILPQVFTMSLVAQNSKDLMENQIYVCAPCNRRCDDLEFEQPGVCQHCNMKLIKKEELQNYPKTNRKKIGFYLQSGVEILDLAGPMEVFNYAGYDVFTISKTKDPIYAQGIMKVIPDYNISDAPESELLVFFGGNAVLPSKDMELINWVKAQNPKYYFSVCSGALILAASGILDGKQATTFRYTLEVLEKKYPKVEVLRGARYVDNGKVITTAGVSAGIDGALHVVAKLKGLPVAAQTAFYMEYDWTPNKGISFPDDNPYTSMNKVEVLKDYEGIFTSNGRDELAFTLDEKGRQLYMERDGKRHPVFYIEKDRFLTSHASHIIEFSRDGNDTITGLESSEYDVKFISK
ncbi:DJ-1/PfpI family protein [Flagellimonas sp. S174]|uniref:DJ-1/PfpI family protein n=1 Tax=Flagellimonas sp. S174 TaxID=3410790 RepID=UPI003BF4CC5E